MSLRTRLIIAFLCLSVIPLSAVTAFWYASSVNAFERAAQREAAQTAVEISRRMEMVTDAVGRRMDRMFAATAGTNGPGSDPDQLRATIAPMLGETAVLLDRVEFHPAPSTRSGQAPSTSSGQAPSTSSGQAPSASHAESMPAPRAEPRRGRGSVTPRQPVAPATPAAPPTPPAPPSAPKAIVVDIPKVMEEARRAAKEGAASAGFDMGPLIDTALTRSIPAMEASMALVEQVAKDAATLAAQEAGKEAARVQADVSGRKIEVAVRRDGRVVGRANAVMNLDRTLHSVLALARRDQGEIPFAIDERGTVYAAAPDQKPMLERLDIVNTGRQAAEGTPRRSGDWIVVARRDPSGLVFGIARPIGESLREIRRMSWRNLSIGLGVIALACIGIVPISHRMTQHVSSLSEGVRQLAGGDFKARVPVRSADEFGALASAFNSMAADLERHQSLVVERERLRRELELSRQIQTEMLPHASLRLGAAEIKGLSIPAREVGGDFFNYFALPDGRLALLVGDVSGKGVSAALLMANVQATLRARLPLETELARLADGLDREIDANTPRGVYLTLFLGILDVDRGLLRYVNAGHNPQFLLHAAGGIQPLSSTGMPIALYPSQGYSESVVDIGRGDLLFFYTDGLVETENASGDMFGAERLQRLLEATHKQGVDRILEEVETSVRAFRGDAEPFDDATMMALRIQE
jgi:serine phosphatase RsbU (regulator of sigma subunit)